MKLRHIVPFLALTLAACGAAPPPAKLTPPSPAVVALAHPPGVPAAPKQAETRTINHQHWSIEVPASWEVSEDTEDGVTVKRPGTKELGPAALQVVSEALDKDTSPEQFVITMSIMAEHQLPDGVKVIDVQRQTGTFKGHASSVTLVLTDKGVFFGVFATVNEATNTGYAVISVAPQTAEDSRLLGVITRTFKMK